MSWKKIVSLISKTELCQLFALVCMLKFPNRRHLIWEDGNEIAWCFIKTLILAVCIYLYSQGERQFVKDILWKMIRRYSLLVVPAGSKLFIWFVLRNCGAG